MDAPAPAPERPAAVSVIIPNWNGMRWLPGCLDALAAQTEPPGEVIVVDNGSADGSREELARRPEIRTLALPENRGFAVAVNRGIAAARGELVALVNTDVVLEADWLGRMRAAIAADPRAAAVACKMVELADPRVLYDTGDVLRRDGACEQRGRFRRDEGRWDEQGEVWGACAGAALYRRGAIVAVGGFDERFFSYLEDVDLALRLRLAGWRCRYEPAIALHAGGGSSSQLTRPVPAWVERNTLLLVAKAFPARWAPLILYRQLGWAWHALRERRLRAHLAGVRAALPLLPTMLAERRALRQGPVAIEEAVPARPVRGHRAGGHPDADQ